MSMRSIEMNSYEPKDIDVLKEEVGYVEFTQAIGYAQTLAKAIIEACIAEVCQRAERTEEQLRGDGICGDAEWRAAPWGIDS